jgi:hypothetical protein
MVINMSRTIRQGKFSKYQDGEFDVLLYRHDSKEDRDGLNKEFRNEEKQYFKKYNDVKYNQKPKSRGWRTH